MKKAGRKRKSIRVKSVKSVFYHSKRMGLPIDIANAYLFLASEEASFINGHMLSVNGVVGF